MADFKPSKSGGGKGGSKGSNLKRVAPGGAGTILDSARKADAAGTAYKKATGKDLNKLSPADQTAFLSRAGVDGKQLVNDINDAGVRGAGGSQITGARQQQRVTEGIDKLAAQARKETPGAKSGPSDRAAAAKKAAETRKKNGPR